MGVTRDWQAVRDGFRAAAARGPLSADDLDAWADAAWWLGLVDESIGAATEAYRLFLAGGQPRRAATSATMVAVNHFLRGEGEEGAGWVSRAQRLMDGEPESVDQGFLRYMLEVEGALDGPDLERVAATARELSALGRRLGDPSLAAAGVLGEGRALVRLGRVPEGMAALDEAMLAALSGEVSPEWAGNIYCHLMAACYELVDLGRFGRWVAATERWLATLRAAAVFSGICRVHRCQLDQIRGEWAAAEREADRVREEVAGIAVATAAEAAYTVAEIRRLRGDAAGAEQAYRMAHRLGRDPQPGLALLRVRQGRTQAAAASIRAALAAETGNRLARARLRAAQVEIALAAGDAAAARDASDELDRIAAAYGTAGLAATAALARGAVLLADGRPEESLGVLRTACRQWRELDAPYEVARVRQVLAEAYARLGDADAAARESAEARTALHRLGAAPTPQPDGLTDREAEVLGLVAAGRTNRQIAAELAIAEKTVARHLSNIFTKIDVASRTEAAAYAFTHGLARG